MPGQKKKALTPYQGKRRAFGHFYCEECDKEWTSANSWANCYQICRDCDSRVYPYKQLRLQKGEGDTKKRKPHRMDLCQRCIETGTRCWEMVEWPRKKS
ncbi:zinc finger CCHC domain-containing protein 24-like isoform X2 [Scylla paramamosain]